MCTERNSKETAHILKKLKNGGNRFWKVYAIHNDRIATLFHGPLCINRGTIRSDRARYINCSSEESYIFYGIHCCAHRRITEEWVSDNMLDFIVPVYGSARSFIGAGEGSVVFDRVRINKEDLRRAIKKAMKTQYNIVDVEDLLRKAYVRS